MGARDAAPGGDRDAAGSTGDARILALTDLPRHSIPPNLGPRLAAVRVYTLADWRRLSHRRKRSIFGITIAHIRLLDALARRSSSGP